MAYPYQPLVFPAPYPNYQNYQAPYQMQQQQAYPGVPQQQITQPTQQIPQANTQQIQPVMQNGGFAFVKNEQEARDYHVAPGNYMTFKDEHAPYLYEKSRSFSQLDEPTFDRYRLVRENDAPQTPTEPQTAHEDVKHEDLSLYALKSALSTLSGEVDDLKDEIEALRKELRGIGEKKPTGRTKKEDLTDE